MPKRILVLLFAACAFLLVACAKSETPTNEAKPTTANANTAPPAMTPAKTAPATAAAIGVPECDDFIAAYDACITDKVPETARAQYKTGIEQWRTSWRKLAENPQTKASLAAACKQSAEQARAAMKTYGCTF